MWLKQRISADIVYDKMKNDHRTQSIICDMAGNIAKGTYSEPEASASCLKVVL